MIRTGSFQKQPDQMSDLSLAEFPISKQTGRQANQCTVYVDFVKIAVQKICLNVHWFENTTI